MAREPFGTRLRSLRERAGMSQTQFAETIGMSEGEISAWERDTAVPEEIAMVDRLAAVLGVSTVELLTGRPADQPKGAIRLTTDNFANHLSADFATSLVKGFAAGPSDIDADDWIVTKLVTWVWRENALFPDVQYEMSRPVAAALLERLAAEQ